MDKKYLLRLTWDQSRPVTMFEDYRQTMRALGGNSGNNVFQYSLQQILCGNNLDVITRLPAVTGEGADACYERINDEYKALVIAPANLLSQKAANGHLQYWADIIRRLRIPVYVIGLGAQSDYENSLSFLEGCQDAAKDFLAAVFDGGGRVGTRGYFTQEVITKLGFSDCSCEVIGCPSIFLRGGNLQIKKADLRPEELIPAVNGTPVWRSPGIEKWFSRYPQAYFVDQDKFCRLLYYPEDLGRKELKFLAQNKLWTDLYQNARLKFYADYASWIAGFREYRTNFSIGSRIHGNIVALQEQTPAYILATDSRVRELAEYFEIPTGKLPAHLPDIYECYQKADYTVFNRNFKKKYDCFCNFMSKCGLSVTPLTQIDLSVAAQWPVTEENRRLLLHQAKICQSSKIAYILYLLYKFAGRCLRGEFRF